MADVDGPPAPSESHDEPDAPARPPDIVLIVTDQHRRDHAGRHDDRFHTPHLDALAARGTEFARAHVANPICMPNRASLATGRMPSVHGTRYNGLPLDPGARTFMHALADAGYHTALVGKLHLQNMGDHPEIVPMVVDRTLAHDAIVVDGPAAWWRDEPPPFGGWDSWELKSRYDRADLDHVVPSGWYGFAEAELAIDHGDDVGGHYARWIAEHGIDPLAARGADAATAVDPVWSEIRTPALGVERYHTTWVAERSVAQIEACPADTPLFLQVSFPDPHHPFTPPADAPRRHDPADLDPPATFDDPHPRSMPHLRALAERRGEQRFHLAAFSPSREQYQAALAAEIATIELIDDAVGRVIEALRRTGRLDSTIVIVTADHGDMFGDHGLMLKTAMHYRAVVEVPFVVAGPGIDAGVAPGLVSTLDLAPTICALAGAEPWWGIQGHDLRPMLDDHSATVRDHVLIEEDQMFDLAQTGEPLRMRTIVTDDGRLTRYRGGSHGELFDHRDDPHELDNRWGLPEGSELSIELHERLADSLAEHADTDRRPAYMA